MPRKRPDSDRDNIVKLYLSGLSINAVAKEMTADPKWVGSVLAKRGIERRSLSEARNNFYRRGGKPANFRTGIDAVDVVRRYETGECILSIASSLDTSNSVVNRILRDEGAVKRSYAEAHALIDREKMFTKIANSKSRKVGWGEDIVYEWLANRGEIPERQKPEGVRNIDMALHPIAVEVWLSCTSPLRDPYCLKRIKYLADRGWLSCYVFVSRRTRVLLPRVAEQIISHLYLARSQPPALREHWVIRGCGELAARASLNLDHITLIEASVDCPHHSCVNRRFAR